MQINKMFFLITLLFSVIFCLLISPTFALDPNSRMQDRYSSPSTGKILPPSTSGRAPVTKKHMTADQKFLALFSRVATLEQTVSALQAQNQTQAQQIAELKQVISVQSGGTVTIQAPGTLKIIAGGTLNMAGSTIDMNAAITGAHGILKADTMMATTMAAKTYSPGAGNIW